MTNNDTFAKRLIQRRAEQGYSQEELSKISGIAAAQISRYEAGKNKPRANIIAKLAEALDISFDWLAYGDNTDIISIADTKNNHLFYYYLKPNTKSQIEEIYKSSGMTLEEIINELLSIGLNELLSTALKAHKKNNTENL